MVKETPRRVEKAVAWKPHGYQKKAVKFMLERACAALFLDPGLGKTSITLAALKILKSKGLIKKVLLIAPLRVCHLVWPREVEKWKDFHGLKVAVLHGKDKDEVLESSDADIFVINPAGLEWLTQATKAKGPSGKTAVTVDLRRWKRLGFDTLVIDELSNFKNSTSLRFKLMKQIHGTFDRRYGLTGSPAANGLLDLFGQAYVLDQGRSLGPYITHYRSRYFNPSWNGFNWTPKDGAEEQIYERLSPLALRMAAEDYLEMPQLVVNNIKVELPAKVRAFYDGLEEELFAMLDDQVFTAVSQGVLYGKCRQVANGGIYLTPDLTSIPGFKVPKERREWLHLHDAKTEALADLVDELQGSPLLVAYDFEHDLDRLRAQFGQDLPYIGGGLPTRRLKELEAAWNHGELPILAGHPAAMGHGLNLQQAGHHVCWYALNPDFELYDQFIRRVLRQGNKSKRVFVHHLVAEDTVDEAILDSLRFKDRTQQALFKGLLELAKRRRARK
jgi:SNF2 family DNA or RNA helicase